MARGLCSHALLVETFANEIKMVSSDQGSF